MIPPVRQCREGHGGSFGAEPSQDGRIVLSIAGLDPSGGAGLAADARVIRQLGFHPALVCTALTAQGERGVTWWEPVRPEGVVAQLGAVLSSGQVVAVKVGMVGDAGLVRPLCQVLETLVQVPIVFDPVLSASAGMRLFTGALTDLAPLLQRARVVTPNLDELALLWGRPVAHRGAMQEAARYVCRQGAQAVLAKGGHLEGAPVDILFDGSRFHEFPGERIEAGPVRGTGCALSAALACALALGASLPEAVGMARASVREALGRSYGLGRRLRYLP